MYMAAFLLLAGCSQLRVSTDYDPDVSLTQLHTFAILKPLEDSEDSLRDERVVRALTGNLEARGYRLTDRASADFHVRYKIGVLHGVPGNVSFGFGFGTFSGGSGASIGTSSRPLRDEAELVIDMLDPEDEKLIWRGSARGLMKSASTPLQREREIRRFVNRVLERFPNEGTHRGR